MMNHVNIRMRIFEVVDEKKNAIIWIQFLRQNWKTKKKSINSFPEKLKKIFGLDLQVPELYSSDGSYTTDPWVPHAAHYGSYAHAAHAHAAQAHAYHHNMAQYGSLLRLPQHYGHSSRLV